MKALKAKIISGIYVETWINETYDTPLKVMVLTFTFRDQSTDRLWHWNLTKTDAIFYAFFV